MGKISGPKSIAKAGVMASALEICGWPKPGNVHRTSDLKGPNFARFICGSVALHDSLYLASLRGDKIGKKRIPASSLKIGSLIKYAYAEGDSWHKGGNTNLGSALLMIPLAAATGSVLSKHGKIDTNRIRNETIKIIKSTTSEDAIVFYKLAAKMQKAWLGRVSLENGPPDVFDPKALKKIRKHGYTFYDSMKASSKWDLVASEISSGMKLTFELAYPKLMKIHRETDNINVATVNTFLEVLSTVPDTFIIRKLQSLGKKNPKIIAAQISEKARRALELGGASTEKGVNALISLDKEVSGYGGALNPGSSADLTAAGLMLLLLSGVQI